MSTITIKQELSPSKAPPLIRIVNSKIQYNEASSIKQECEIHIIDFAKLSNIVKPKIFQEFSFDRIKHEPELHITDELGDIQDQESDEKLKINEIYANFQRLKSSNWQEQIIKKVNKPKFSCEYCDKDFTTGHGLVRHIGSYHKDFKKKNTNLICDHCGKSFIDKQRIFNHMRLHKSFVNCKICNKSMIPVSLSLHMKEVHGKHKNYKCPLCDKIYASENKFKQHTKTHVKKFECQICKRNFSASYRYKQHMMWHEDSSVFSCKICSKQFNRKANLSEHIKIHNKESLKTYNCHKCDFKTIYSRRITYHLNTHVKNEKREEKFKKTNKGVRCEICSAILANKYTLKAHIATVHLIQKFICDLCGVSFKTKNNTKKHMSRFHLK